MAVATLLILTAWGNAVAMLVFSVAGLLVGAVIYRKALFSGAALVAFVGFVIAVVIGLALATGLLG